MTEKQGFTKFQNTYFFDLVNGQDSNVKLVLDQNEITTYDNIISYFQQPTKNVFLNYKKIDFYSSPKSNNLTNLYTTSFVIEIPIYKNIIIRTYQTIDEVFASLNGLFQLFFSSLK